MSNSARTLGRHYHEANASSHGRPKHDGRGVFVGWRSPVDSSAGQFRGGQLVTAAAGNLTHTVRLADTLSPHHHHYRMLASIFLNAMCHSICIGTTVEVLLILNLDYVVLRCLYRRFAPRLTRRFAESLCCSTAAASTQCTLRSKNCTIASSTRSR